MCGCARPAGCWSGRPFPSSWPWSGTPHWRGLDAPVWRPSSVTAALTLRYALSRMDLEGVLPEEDAELQVAMPARIDLDVPVGDVPDWLLPALVSPAGKRVLDLLSDWAWVSRPDLAGLMGVAKRRVSQVVALLEEFGLVSGVQGEGSRRLALSDRGLALLARRDRTSVATGRRRWSAAALDPEEPLTWRNVSGSRSRQLLRNVEHTVSVHQFLAALTEQARALGWDVPQLDPPHRASRYFQHDGTLRSVRPRRLRRPAP